MTVVRRLARPMLASVFVWGGMEALRNPEPKEPAADRVGPSIAAKIPYLPEDPETLVKLNAAVQLGAGSLLALGRFPRLSSMLLAGSLVPTTLAGHRFWEEKDPEERYRQRGNFLKNVGLLGGLDPRRGRHRRPARPGVARQARDAPRRRRHPAGPSYREAGSSPRRPRHPRETARLTDPVGPAARTAGPATLPA